MTVAKEIELSDKFENMGAQTVKDGASRASDQVGDETTTATASASANVREGANVVAAGMNPMDLKRGVDGCPSSRRSRRSFRMSKTEEQMEKRMLEAAERGDAAAQFNLAVMYENELLDSRYGPKGGSPEMAAGRRRAGSGSRASQARRNVRS